jgi:alkylmercury lyase
MSGYNLSRLAGQLNRSLCNCNSEQCEPLTNDLGLCRTLIQLLAKAQPLSADLLARASGRSRVRVLAAFQASSSVELDAWGQIVGAGLSLSPTQHRLWIEGRLLYAWCALDVLMYPPLLGVTARVESQCAASANALRMQVSNKGVQDVTPTEVVVSMVTPERKCGVRQEFCHHVHFFRSASDA